MRLKYTLFLSSLFAFWSCSGDGVSDPVSPGLPQGNGNNSPPKTAVSVSISIDSVGPDGFREGDTVSITARVVDNAGAVVDTASVVWNQLLDIRCRNCVMSDMNSQHEIVGVLATSSYHAFKWTAQSGVENLASGGYDRSFAMAINESGDIAGYVNSSLQQDIVSRAAVWTSSGLKLLEPVTGIRSTQARDINDVGQVLIYAR